MFHLSAAVDGDVICNSDTFLAFFKDVIHLLLEDVLGTDQAQVKSLEMISSKGAVESFKQAGVLVKDN